MEDPQLDSILMARPPKAAPLKPSPGDFIWLAYSLFFLVEPALRGGAVYWLKNLAIYATFVSVYFFFHTARAKRNQLLLIALMAGIGMASLPLNTGATCFFIFAAAFVPFVIESEMVVALTLALGGIALLVEALLLHVFWVNIAIGVGMSAVVGVSNTFIAQKKRANTRLSLAQDEVVRIAAVAERERIARDLHDVLGHTLSVIVLKAELAGRLLANRPEAAAKEIAEVESTARAALSEVREAIGGYRTRGLHAEIEQARRTLDAAGVKLYCELPSDEALFTATEETVLSLAVREAVTNIVRHAQAATCSLIFTARTDGSRILLVEDDGGAGPLREGNGLRGMRERVQALGGQLSIAHRTVRGTALRIEIPSSGLLVQSAAMEPSRQ